MERTERLFGLVTLLLDAKRPMPFEEIRDAFDDYAKVSREAAERKFSRDKAALLELGIPLEYREPTEDDEGGYLVDRDLYFLPQLKLEPEELAVLYVASTAAHAMEGFPWAVEVERALEKIRFAAEESGTTPAPFARQLAVRPGHGMGDKRGQISSALWDAIRRGKRVTLVYHAMFRDQTETREVDPYGLFTREGVWCLYGYCHLRQAERTFHLDRIQSVTVNSERPGTPDFQPPEDLDLRALASLRPWEFPIEPPVAVTLRLSPHLAFGAKALFGDRAEVEPEDGGAARVRVEARHLDALLSHLLSLKGDAIVLEPAELREELCHRLSRVVEAHR
ncbi:MAG: WYL domain-containing protein [Deltaproteobacteria bacterium]|nr:MAG: WYL domain-containing protein [Deltaproteobacteria bacterium]